MRTAGGGVELTEMDFPTMEAATPLVFCLNDNYISRQTRHLDDEVILVTGLCVTTGAVEDADVKYELIVLHLRIGSCTGGLDLACPHPVPEVNLDISSPPNPSSSALLW